MVEVPLGAKIRAVLATISWTRSAQRKTQYVGIGRRNYAVTKLGGLRRTKLDHPTGKLFNTGTNRTPSGRRRRR